MLEIFHRHFVTYSLWIPKHLRNCIRLIKKLHSIKFSYRNANICFDHAVEIYSRKCQRYVRYGTEFFRRPILSEETSSEYSWRDLESNVVNGALIFRTKIQKLLFKVPTFLKTKTNWNNLIVEYCLWTPGTLIGQNI